MILHLVQLRLHGWDDRLNYAGKSHASASTGPLFIRRNVIIALFLVTHHVIIDFYSWAKNVNWKEIFVMIAFDAGTECNCSSSTFFLLLSIVRVGSHIWKKNIEHFWKINCDDNKQTDICVSFYLSTIYIFRIDYFAPVLLASFGLFWRSSTNIQQNQGQHDKEKQYSVWFTIPLRWHRKTEEFEQNAWR